MKYEIDTSFIRDVKKAPKNIQLLIAPVIAQIEKATQITDISKIKKMSGYKNVYRIRIHDYRIGFYLENETIILSRALSRKEIYKYFPNK